MTSSISLDDWWTRYQAEYQDRTWRDYRWLLAEMIRHGFGGPILDVGCGYGFLVECARQFGIPAIGLEGSVTAVHESRTRHPAADVRHWEAGTALGLESESVQIAVLNQFVEHIALQENQQLFSDLARVLTPGGLLMVYSSSRFNRFDTDAGHVTFFSPTEFRSFVSGFGFRVAAQPYIPQPLLGTGIGQTVMRVLTRHLRPERWAATIDLIAYKPKRPSGLGSSDLVPKIADA